jgi:hypothetical protein
MLNIFKNRENNIGHVVWDLKSLIFGCFSFTEDLITSLSTADGEAPASSRTFATSVCPHCADRF